MFCSSKIVLVANKEPFTLFYILHFPHQKACPP
jgi:hypothetical protein